MSDDSRVCGACDGTGLTEHQKHTVETAQDGAQTVVVTRWTGACSGCAGTGSLT
ncbi:hypothetical protein [Streptomyces sp. NPDC014894]|uniref:hypothetical protein n=1 Tax=unclassified Streptomyces TaxID=2593676 RepID=UPI0036F612A5